MLPRNDFAKRRLFERLREEMPEDALVCVLNGEFKIGRKAVDPQIPIGALTIIRHLEGLKYVHPFGVRLMDGTPYDEKSARRLALLNRLLHQYQSAPKVDYITPEGIWHRVRAADIYRQMEEFAISRMMDLAELGQLYRLRQCKNVDCSRWFYARLPDNQACCSKSCGQKFNASDEEKRKARNARRRQNRAMEAQRAEAQKNAKPWPDNWTSRGQKQARTKKRDP